MDSPSDQEPLMLDFEERSLYKVGDSKKFKLFRKIFGLNTVLSISVLSLLLFIAAKSIPRSDRVKPEFGPWEINQALSRVTNCGETPDQARNAGCRFDILSFGWTSPECFDSDLYEEVTSGHNFTWSKISGETMTTAEVQSGNHHEVLSTWDDYLIACTYAWQRITRTALRQWPIDEWSASYAVAETCAQDLLHREKLRPGDFVMLNKMWFPRCGLNEEEMLQMVNVS